MFHAKSSKDQKRDQKNSRQANFSEEQKQMSSFPLNCLKLSEEQKRSSRPQMSNFHTKASAEQKKDQYA